MRKKGIALSVVVVLGGVISYGIMSMNTTKEFTSEVSEECQSFKGIDYKALEPVDMSYDVGTRFGGIKKEAIMTNSTFEDFLRPQDLERIESIVSTRIIFVENDAPTHTRFTGKGNALSDEQLNFLRQLDYSENFSIGGTVKLKYPKREGYEESYFNPHLTVVPEKEATYSEGIKEIITALDKEVTPYTLGMESRSMRPAKMYFTITKTGEMKDLRVVLTSGHKVIDEKTFEVISNLKGNWIPAEDIDGNRVDQELVVSFGTGGC